MINKSLYSRFKELYEKETGYKIVWSNLDPNEKLTVGIKMPETGIEFWLNVIERNGEVIWY